MRRWKLSWKTRRKAPVIRKAVGPMYSEEQPLQRGTTPAPAPWMWKRSAEPIPARETWFFDCFWFFHIWDQLNGENINWISYSSTIRSRFIEFAQAVVCLAFPHPGRRSRFPLGSVNNCRKSSRQGISIVCLDFEKPYQCSDERMTSSCLRQCKHSPSALVGLAVGSIKLYLRSVWPENTLVIPTARYRFGGEPLAADGENVFLNRRTVHGAGIVSCFNRP